MARNKNRTLFSDLGLGEKPEAETPPTERKRTSGYLQERESGLAQLASGAIVEKTLLWVDPERCRMWARHNRRYDLLNEVRCRDLIEGIKAQGKQEFPAVVRRLRDDPNYEYEVICGARRHWTISWLRRNNYPQFRFLIEVRELTDEEAFRLSDVENRDKEDISDYERAQDYRGALRLYYKTQKQMAERLEVSEAWLSRYLDLADLPQEIIQAYDDITQINIQHTRDLKPLLKDNKTRAKLLAKAQEIAGEQERARSAGKEGIKGPAVVSALKSACMAGDGKRSNGALASYKTQLGKPMFTVERVGKAGLVLKFPGTSGASKEELIAAFTEAVEKFF
jgi:ParB family chromosome partitioning protein